MQSVKNNRSSFWKAEFDCLMFLLGGVGDLFPKTGSILDKSSSKNMFDASHDEANICQQCEASFLVGGGDS